MKGLQKMTLPWKINNHEILCTFVFFRLVCINYELLKDILYLIYRNSITNTFTELLFQGNCNVPNTKASTMTISRKQLFFFATNSALEL